MLTQSSTARAAFFTQIVPKFYFFLTTCSLNSRKLLALGLCRHCYACGQPLGSGITICETSAKGACTMKKSRLWTCVVALGWLSVMGLSRVQAAEEDNGKDEELIPP